MKRFVKLSEVKKKLRSGCQLDKKNMALLDGGEDNTSGPTTSLNCPYQSEPENCQFLVNGCCTLDQLCKDVIIYSATPPPDIGG